MTMFVHKSVMLTRLNEDVCTETYVEPDTDKRGVTLGSSRVAEYYKVSKVHRSRFTNDHMFSTVRVTSHRGFLASRTLFVSRIISPLGNGLRL